MSSISNFDNIHKYYTEEFLIQALQKLPKLNSVDGRIVLQDLYEKQYGIYNHLDPSNKSRPLSSVAMHACEDVNNGSLLEEAVKTYVVRGIKDLYGLNLIEFLELPLDIVELLFEISGQELAKKSATLSDVEKQFNSTKK